MTIKWQDYTEIVVGFALKDEMDPHAINPDDCFPPFNEVVAVLQKGGDVADVVSKCGYPSVRDATVACENVNGDVPPLKWLKLLQESASKFKNGKGIKELAEALMEGRDVDLGRLMSYASQINMGYRPLTPLSEIEPEENSWIPTGYRPIDDNIGGVPKAGLVLIAASPGVGKTTLVLKTIAKMVHRHRGKKIAFFSLEMLMSQVAKRYRDLLPDLSDRDKARILMSDSAYSVNEIYAVATQAAASENLAAIAIDFADLMVDGEQTEAVMGRIYRQLSVLAKQAGIPVFLICQLNRNTYTGGIPKINHIRYSGMAEAMASLIILLYNPNTILVDMKQDQTQLVAADGRGYLIVGKSRFGFKKGGPGAIQVEWDGEGGWGDAHFGYTFLNSV